MNGIKAEGMHVKWSDYLSTVIIRAISGTVIGLGVSVPVLFFGGSPRFHFGRARSPLVDWIQDRNYRALAIWFGAWTLGGALIAVVTIPRWQTPWYRGALDTRANPEIKPKR
jgi:hypothetical protein